MTIHEIKTIFNNSNIENFRSDISKSLKEQKEEAVKNKDQELAKDIWCLEQIFAVLYNYIYAFDDMKKGKFIEAWYKFDRTDIELSFLKKHFDYDKNIYRLKFIEMKIQDFQKLFPYNIFFSRESIESDFTCSICGKPMNIRNVCSHEIGEIYDGEMCGRVVNKVEFKGLAMVRNPVDRYTVPQMEGYNYTMLQSLLESLSTPFDNWTLEIINEKWNYKNDARYKNVHRNSPCPCGSGTKFRKCCFLKEKTIKHYKITLELDEDTIKNFKPKSIHF